MDSLVFLTDDQVRSVRAEFGSPIYVYDEQTFLQRAEAAKAFPNAFGLTVRYAMKALPTAAIIQIMDAAGIHIDASSGYEAQRAMLAGVAPEHIQITAQEMPENFAELIEKGVHFNACSMYQLERYGQRFPGAEVSVRMNPGLGSGHSNRTNVGGPSASFGIWHEHLDEVKAIAARHNLKITGLHSHIGSGSDPDTWVHCANLTLGLAAQLPDVTRVSLGGGFKVARMDNENATDLKLIGPPVKEKFETFATEHGRELHMEIEPGTYLAANAGALVCTVIDTVDTGADGYRFIKLDAGMAEILRPSMYGAQHPLIVVPPAGESRGTAQYLVAGHCCESGDVLTPAPGNSEGLEARTLVEAQPGDAFVIEGAGAYCSGMPAKNYNSFPECAEVLLTKAGDFRLIRRRQTLEQIIANESTE